MPIESPEEIVSSVYIATVKGGETFSFQGLDECDCQVVLKRATLHADCEDEGRVIVDVMAKDHKDKRVEGPLCSLNLNYLPSVSLENLSMEPPIAFKLSKGQ